MFIGLLTSIVNASNHTKFVSISNQKGVTQPALIISHFTKYAKILRYYPSVVNLDRCVRSCNTLNDLSNKVCLPNKADNLNLSIFNMTTGINKLKT